MGIQHAADCLTPLDGMPPRSVAPGAAASHWSRVLPGALRSVWSQCPWHSKDLKLPGLRLADVTVFF